MKMSLFSYIPLQHEWLKYSFFWGERQIYIVKLFFSSGGKTYDKDHVVIMPENDERPSQQWEIELL